MWYNACVELPGSPVSAKLEFKGEVPSAPLGRAVHALVDAISPFTEGLGLIGDHIRVQRYEVAIKIANRAKGIVKANGGKIHAPPLKFMVPFLELSSLEDMGEGRDSRIIELWSQLLADACTEYESEHLTFMRILSEVDGSQVRYLESLAGRHDFDQSLMGPGDMAQQYSLSASRCLGDPFDVEVIEGKMYKATRDEAEQIAAKLIEFTPDFSCRLIHADVPYRDTQISNETIYSSHNDHRTVALTLERQGLVIIEQTIVRSDIGKVRVGLACLSPLGESFLSCCKFKEQVS